MEVQELLVPGCSCLHLQVRLVADNVVDEVKIHRRHHIVELFLEVVGLEAWQKGTGIVDSLHECVDGISVCLDASDYDGSIVVLKSLWFLDALGSPFDSLIVDANSIIHCECDILDSVSVTDDLSAEFLVAWVKGRCECEYYVSILYYMGAVFSMTGLQALVSYVLEAEAGCVE